MSIKKGWLVLLAAMLLMSCDRQKDQAAEIQTSALGAATPMYHAEVFTGKTMGGMLDPVSKAFFLVGQQGSIQRSEDGYNWTYTDTPLIHTLHKIAGNTKSGVLIAVGDGGTILRSTDGGHTWLQAQLELPAGVNLETTQLKSVIHHPAKDVWLAAGTQNTVLRSTDQGKSWQLTSYNSGETQLEILSLFVQAETGDVLFAAQHGTMGRSSDAGATWNITHHDMEVLPGSYIPHLVAFYQYGDTLIMTADLGRLLVSKDQGKNWKLFKLSTTGYFTGSAYDPASNSIVLITQEGDDIITSHDNGDSWQVHRIKVIGWPNDDIPMLSAIVYDDKSKAFLAMGSSGIVARSVNGGRFWRAELLKPLFNLSLTTLLHDPERDLFVASGLGGFIHVTKGLKPDPTLDWETVRPGIDLYMRQVINLPGSNTFIIVGQLGGIWRSEDDGRNWNFIEPDYPYPNQPPHFRDIIIDPTSGALVAAGPDGSIIRSTDTGKTWKPVFQGVITLGEAFTQILIDKRNKTLIAYEAMYQSTYLSKDGGVNWEKVATIPTDGRHVWHGAISEKLGLIVVTGQKGAVATSNDGGYTWEAAQTGINEEMYGAFADEKSGALFVVGEKGKILRSEDGKQWQSVKTGIRSTLRRMTTDPKTGALLAFGQEGGILRSTDNGKNWEAAATPVTDTELRTALVEPGSNNLIIVGRNGVILRSEDGGKNWIRLPSHTDQHFRSAGFNPVTGTIVAVGDGLVRLSRRAN